MITSGEIDDPNYFDNYYSKITKRSEKKCRTMYDFHSFVKKKIIKDNCKGTKKLLDTSVGKGGDLNHWIDAGVSTCIGLDISKDGLNSSINGACNRILNKASDIDDISIAENYMMIWADTSKNIINGEAGKDSLNKYYLDIIYGNIPFETIDNGKLRNMYNIGNVKEPDGGFDIVSSQFSVHYYFKTEETLNTYLRNVSESLKVGGRFIGTCLNGNEVFEMLKDKPLIESEEQLCWKISKKYKKTKFEPTEEYLGMEIDVYNESIGATLTEYLVNINYFDSICEKYGLKKIVNSGFENLFSQIPEKDYGKAKSMSADLKTYSFLNNYFVYEKV